ncbi:MAG: hypothetical protein HY851_01610 [candidate division Zixibacteria bacterium]|nr:hypothetical protein [candidate division Zixibacteria bacterium]
MRIGDSAELLAEYLLGRIAFVSRVPRQEDVGHDLLCTLYETVGDLLKAGGFFAVQVKSSKSPIRYKKSHELNWISSQENPFFIGIADTEAQSLELYSTGQILRLFLWKAPKRVTLRVGFPKKRSDQIVFSNNYEAADVYLGAPVVKLVASEISDDPTVTQRANLLQYWVAIDRENLVRRATKMYWVLGPSNYETNQKPSEIGVQFFWNPENLPGSFDNFLRASVALLNVLHDLDRNWSQIALYEDLIKLFEGHDALSNHPASVILKNRRIIRNQ